MQSVVIPAKSLVPGHCSCPFSLFSWSDWLEVYQFLSIFSKNLVVVWFLKIFPLFFCFPFHRLPPDLCYFLSCAYSGVICIYFSIFLQVQTEVTGWAPSVGTFSAGHCGVNFALSTAFHTVPMCWVSIFILLRTLPSFLFHFPLTQGLFRSVLFRFQIFEHFPRLFLLLIYNLIPYGQRT